MEREICSYIIPRSGNNWWQQNRRCTRPAGNSGRCRIHEKDRVERGRRAKIDRYIKEIEKLGGKVIKYSYNWNKKEPAKRKR